MNDGPILSLDTVSKRLTIGTSRSQSTLAHILSSTSGVEAKRTIWPIKELSLDVSRGEKLGIIGRNGAGKSTLLKVTAGLYQPDGGTITRRGRVMFLANMNNGLKPRLSVRDNVFLVGALLGLQQKSIRQIFDTVIEFAGLKDFVDSKLYQLSNGMRTRLAFSNTIHGVELLDPEILLLDEVTSGGGDEEFRAKSTAKIESLFGGGRTLILVSHSFPTMAALCDSAVWLEAGGIRDRGPVEEVASRYKASIIKSRVSHLLDPDR